MYKSPIEIYEAADKIRMQIIRQQNEDIYNAVLSYGIAVDKEELLRALRYDRDQYNKGYADGKRDAVDEVIRCKDCKWWKTSGCWFHQPGKCAEREADDFCSDGERRTNERKAD